MSDDLAHAVEDLLEDHEVSLLMMNGSSTADGGIMDDLGDAGNALGSNGHGIINDAEQENAGADHHGIEDEEDQDLLRETFGSDADDDAAGDVFNCAATAGESGSGGGGSGGAAGVIIGGASSECGLCQRQLSEPVILACLHRFDLACLEASQGAAAGGFLLFCPRCQTPTVLNPETGLSGLTRDHLYLQELQGAQMAEVKCGGCTTGAEAVAKCRECADYLCSTCRQAHSVMKMFSRHHVQDLQQPGSDPEAASGLLQKPIYCQEHPTDQLKYYCRDCASLHCPECVATGHKQHSIDLAATAGVELGGLLAQDAKSLRDSRRRWEREQDKLQERLSEIAESQQHNEGAIKEALASYRAFLDEAGKRFLEENRRLHSELEMHVMELLEHTAKGAEQMGEAADFVQAYSERAGPVVLSYAAKVLRDWSATLLRAHWDTNLPTAVPFAANHPNFRAMVFANFGAFGGGGASGDAGEIVRGTGGARASAAAATPVSSGVAVGGLASHGVGSFIGTAAGDLQANSVAAAVAASMGVGPYPTSAATKSATGGAAIVSEAPPPPAAVAPAASYTSNPALYGLPPPSQPSPGAPGSDSGLSNGSSEPLLSSMLAAKLQLVTDHHHPSMSGSAAGHAAAHRSGTPTGGMDFGGSGVITGGGAPGSLDSPQQSSSSGGAASGVMGSAMFPARTGRCSSMTVRHRWGSLGSARGQFNSPHGFCLGTDEEIVVADTQNHRVQVFDKSGEHRFQFGVPGREEGQLWYPRKVVVVRQSGKFIVCDRGSERSRMQIFSRTGNFLRKITVRYIDIVAGLAINSQGHIVAVDSVSPTVFVIAENGDLIKWFDCSSYMREPSDIAVQGREYFICDFKGHCVCVFQEDGAFLRRIGSESITNFPNGIDISDHGDVLIGDSHGNKFHVAVFNRLGQLTSEFECPTVKVSRCCGLKITSEGYVVTLAKNNHHVLVLNTLYIG